MAKERKASGFGVRLREMREARGMSQAVLGDLLGVSAQAVAKYEAGTEPTWPVVLRLAEALGVSPNDFKPGPPPPASKRK